MLWKFTFFCNSEALYIIHFGPLPILKVFSASKYFYVFLSFIGYFLFLFSMKLRFCTHPGKLKLQEKCLSCKTVKLEVSRRAHILLFWNQKFYSSCPWLKANRMGWGSEHFQHELYFYGDTDNVKLLITNFWRLATYWQIILNYSVLKIHWKDILHFHSTFRWRCRRRTHLSR